MKHLKYFNESVDYNMDEIFVEILDEGFEFWDYSFNDNIIRLKREVNDINNTIPPMPRYDHSLPREESDRIFSKYSSNKEAQLGRWTIEAVAIDKNADCEGMLWGNVWRKETYSDMRDEEYSLYKKAFDACVTLLHFRDEKYIDLKMHSIPFGSYGIVSRATQVIAISFQDRVTKENPFKLR